MTGPGSAYLDERRALVEQALAETVGEGRPETLYGAARYVLEGGGKRLRPLLVLLAAEHHGLRAEQALGPALAVEIFHNFTLVHDDIMDDAPTRRGRATVHEKWDQPTAILVGDLLMGVAYERLAAGPRADRLLPVFASMVRRLCEGQMLDMALGRRSDVSIHEYLDMIDRKTAALLACALELGAASAGAGEPERAVWREAGRGIGRAFQIQDDLLDLTATGPRWGKPVGGDVVEGKRTFLLITALDRASGEDRQVFEAVLRGEVDAAGVDDVRIRMDRLGVLSDTRDAVILHTGAAVRAISSLEPSEPRDALLALVRSMQARTN